MADIFRETIDQFKPAYLALNVTISPKNHVIFDHVTQFCEEKKSGLGKFSEQASESVHSDFKKTWENVKVNSDSFGRLLNRAILKYNILHLF